MQERLDKINKEIIKLEDKLWELKLERSKIKRSFLIQGCENTKG